MATKAKGLARSFGLLRHVATTGSRIGTCSIAQRNINTSFQGPIPPEPLRKKFSMPIVTGCIVVGIVVGQYLAKSFAEFLEETDLFVPDDDDDD